MDVPTLKTRDAGSTCGRSDFSSSLEVQADHENSEAMRWPVRKSFCFRSACCNARISSTASYSCTQYSNSVRSTWPSPSASKARIAMSTVYPPNVKPSSKRPVLSSSFEIQPVFFSCCAQVCARAGARMRARMCARMRVYVCTIRIFVELVD